MKYEIYICAPALGAYCYEEEVQWHARALSLLRNSEVQVKALASIGIPHAQIAEFLGLRSPQTVRRHFRKELARGEAEATAQVAQVCQQMAESGKFPVITMFWINTIGSAIAAGSARIPILGKIISKDENGKTISVRDGLEAAEYDKVFEPVSRSSPSIKECA